MSTTRTILMLCVAIGWSARPATAQEPAPPAAPNSASGAAPAGSAPCVAQTASGGAAACGVCPRCGQVHAHGAGHGHRSWHDALFSPFGRQYTFIKLDPPYYPPPGSAVNPFWHTQMANGDAARMVLYHYDFFAGESRLNDRGRQQLAKIQAMLATNPFPLIIQPTPGGAELDELRRQHVFELLAGGPYPVPIERIQIRQPPARGLDGPDAEVIYPGLLGLTGGGGGGLGGGGASGGAGGFGGGSSTAGGSGTSSATGN